MKELSKSEQQLGTIELNKHIGFSSVPDLIRNRSIEDGFEINVLVTGRRGLGSSTLMNSLFGAPIISKSRTNDLSVTKNEIIENGISLKTTTATYHSDKIKTIIDYIDSKNMEYFENEQGPYKIHKDTRIHVCLYLIPSDHFMDSEIDFIKAISKKTNFVPVIPKADMYTNEELSNRKTVIFNILQDKGVLCFSPTNSEENADSDVEDLDNHLPFAVIASETVHEIGGEIIRGRKYPWGFIDIEDEEGNDFKSLQRMLIYKHFDELINKTHIKFYNDFRKNVMEIERNSENIQLSRYDKLKNEMNLILKERYQKKIKELREEEDLLDAMLRKMDLDGNNNRSQVENDNSAEEVK
jgi:septin 7